VNACMVTVGWRAVWKRGCRGAAGSPSDLQRDQAVAPVALVEPQAVGWVHRHFDKECCQPCERCIVELGRRV
jgi:hypothetical protein